MASSSVGYRLPSLSLTTKAWSVSMTPQAAIEFTRKLANRMLSPVRLTAQQAASPTVQRSLFVTPDADSMRGADRFELGRNLHPVPVRIVYEREQVVAGSVTAGPPLERNSEPSEVVGPIPDQVPGARLEAIV